MKTFLSAEWQNLINLTYEVPAELLQPLLPKGVELDLLNGKAHVSLVAFDFLNTRVKGVKVPFHVNFPEVNLRYYVQYKGRRGVCFIREYVPKHCIALIANRFFNEPYVAFPMESESETQADGSIHLKHRIWRDKDKFTLELDIVGEAQVPSPDSIAHFFKEHDLGFGTDHKGESLAYFVEHPVWESREIRDLKLDFDFEKLYGPEWAFLTGAAPTYQLHAVGSGIKVYSALRLPELEVHPLFTNPHDSDSA